ncbi:uncharacterized protein LOC112590710 [Harpegnathos saltator]|uniref:uncharacterized protein LOC112590710 n=1 Tax=Harpegnathos saltator TaxID=610380 RepID=UPI000DBEE630|nr:uncharacterized protein LOC112590710 [Harpegnathos saltator]XP_025163845.1 uncharacterized protein LOC112590710 [Harpegnathos saltator]
MSDIPLLFSQQSSLSSCSSSPTIYPYRNFFNPNICHWCKGYPGEHGKENNICLSCNMILYCSRDHELKGKGNHQEICGILEILLQNHPEFWKTYYFNQEEWIKSRKNLLNLVKSNLQRDMMPYEMQMIMFAKSCFVCHEQRNLQTCSRCLCLNYCSDHDDFLTHHHSTNCTKLKSCDEINRDIYYMTLSNCKYKFYELNASQIEKFKAVNIEQFLERFAYTECQAEKQFTSDYLSGPLTLYYGIMNQDLYINDLHCVVHIIVANVLDAHYVLLWEIMLHLCSKRMKHLRVILIGSKIQTEGRRNVEVCRKCNERKSQFEFESYRMVFRDYANIILSSHPPNVIIAFEADISKWDLQTDIMLKLKRQSCPFIVTTASPSKYERNIRELRKALRIQLDLTPNENKFSSLKAYRNFEDDDVLYRNKFLFVIRNLSDLLKSYTDPNTPGSSH